MKKPNKLKRFKRKLRNYPPGAIHAWILDNCREPVIISTAATSPNFVRIAYHDPIFRWPPEQLLRDLTTLHANGVVGYFEFDNALEGGRFRSAFP